MRPGEDYVILLIITDGEITDMENTKHAIVQVLIEEFRTNITCRLDFRFCCSDRLKKEEELCCIQVSLVFFSVFCFVHAKSGTANNNQNGSSDILY